MSSISLNSNISSLKVQRSLSRATESLSRTFERLSSGQRINRASDDAAGLAIAGTLRADSRVFTQGIRNINDGISSLSIAEGALTQLSLITIRQKELSEQAASGSYSLDQRTAINTEANALVSEFNRIIESTSFNGISLLQNSDTSLRLQAGYSTTGSLSIQLGSSLARTVGDGTFQAAVSLPGADGEGSITSADLNNDGLIDLVSAALNADSVLVRLGNGDGTFRASVSFTSGDGASSIVVGDINNDGNLDLISTSNLDDKVNIFLGNGNGTFQSRVSYAAGDIANHVVLGDFNRDGSVDLATSASNDDKIYILINNGNGTFRAGVSYAVGDSPAQLAIGDFNGDNISDIAAANSNDDRLHVLIGAGNGTFWASRSYASGDGSFTPAVGDYNSDGYADIVISSLNDDSLSVFIARGDGTFKGAVSYVAGDIAAYVSNEDVNGDGILDLISTSVNDDSVSIFIGNGDGTFKNRVSYNGGDGARGIALADFNRDGAYDLAIADLTGDSASTLLGVSRRVNSIARLNLLTQSSARDSLELLDSQLNRISAELGNIGAFQSRLEVASKTLANSRENFIAAESRISDADVAQESSEYVKTQILQQASSSVLAQANQLPALAIRLLS